MGTIGVGKEVFDKPMTPAEVHRALYTKVQPFNIIAAVLQQELIRYCGTLISVNRHFQTRFEFDVPPAKMNKAKNS